MKNLLLSSFFAAALMGCTLGHYHKLQPLSSLSPASGQMLKPVFSNHADLLLFKTNISIYGKAFSGLLATKQLQPADYRVIFTTELGMKLFDFEFTDSAFTLHYCVPQFNRQALLKTIQQDIEILLMNRLDPSQVSYFTDRQKNYTIGRITSGKFSDYYFLNNQEINKPLIKIEHAKGQVKKTTFTLDNYMEDIPGHILIQHHNIKLKIELMLLKK